MLPLFGQTGISTYTYNVIFSHNIKFELKIHQREKPRLREKPSKGKLGKKPIEGKIQGKIHPRENPSNLINKTLKKGQKIADVRRESNFLLLDHSVLQ